MTMVVEVDEVEVRETAKYWWLFLCTGIGWILVSLVVLAFDPTSVAVIGYMAAFLFLAAGVTEFANMIVAPGWRWLHGVLGAIFLITGFVALSSPFQTFGLLAVLIGWYLILKGSFDVGISIATRDDVPLWGLLLASGILQIAIGLWALGYPGRSAWLLVIWVGIGALMRGISQMILAFQLRHAAHAV